MRKFSEKEKEYIRKIVKLKKSANALSKQVLSNYPQNVLYSELISEKVLLDFRDKNKPCMFFFRKENEIISSERTELCCKFMEFAILIQYLKERGLIYLFRRDEDVLTFPNLEVSQNRNFFEKCEEDGLIKGPPLKMDKYIVELLLGCIDGYMYVSETLVDLVANDFLTVEERNLGEAREQTKFAINILEEAKLQSNLAKESVEESKRQSNSARSQTKYAIGAFVASSLATLVALLTFFGITLEKIICLLR